MVAKIKNGGGGKRLKRLEEQRTIPTIVRTATGGCGKHHKECSSCVFITLWFA